MKKLVFTYSAIDIDGAIGEAACIIECYDSFAAQILAAQEGARIPCYDDFCEFAEKLIDSVEYFRGREYVRGSVKDIRAVEKSYKSD